MVIRNLFKAKPEVDREPSLRDRDQVLAWLEELARLRTVMELRVQQEDALPIQAKVELVGEETSTCTLSLSRLPAVEPKQGQALHLVFPMDGHRFRASLAYRSRGGYMQCVFALPEAIHHAERREVIRARFGNREKAHVALLQGFFEGVAMGGQLVNLSMGGCAFRLQKALDVRGGRKLPLRPDLLPPGTQVALLRLQDLPQLPMVECSGVVAHLDQRSEGLIVGVRFEALGGFESQIIGKLMGQRVPGFRRGFPRKRRRKDLTDEELKAPQPSLEAPLLPEPPLEEGDTPFELDLTGVMEAEQEIQSLQEEVKEKNHLHVLRKRGKRLLVLMADDLDRAILVATLQVDGYRSVFEAKSLVQALDFNRKVAFEGVILDQKVGQHGALEVLDALRANGLPKNIPAVVLQYQPEVRLSLALKGGAVDLVMEHPVDFDGILKGALEGLLGL